MTEHWIILGLSAVIIVLGACIKFGEYLNLIPGYNSATLEEQEYMKKKKLNGYMGRQLMLIGLAPVVGVLLNRSGLAWGIEIGFALLLIVVISMALEIHRFTPPDSELNKKHFKLYMGAAGLLILVYLGVGGGLYYSSTENPKVSVQNEQIVIGGAYGTQFPISDIDSVELKDKLPNISSKSSGISFGPNIKGHYDVEGIGHSQLFIRKSGSVVAVSFKSGREPILINFNDPEQTRSFFVFLQSISETDNQG